VTTALTDELPVVALVGRPNVGKSTFLARASGRFAETANAPGTTVSLERRRIRAGRRDALLVDLPGTRSLDDVPAGDDPFWALLVEAAPDAILVVADASDLGRHLPLVIACRDLGLPVILAANLADEAARRGLTIDAGRLGQVLNVRTHVTCGRAGLGVDRAVADAVRLASIRREVRAGRRSPRSTIPAGVYPYEVEGALRRAGDALVAQPRSLGAAALEDPLVEAVARGRISARGAASIRLAATLDPYRWAAAAAWAAEAEHRRDVPEPLADRIGRWSTSPFPGIPIVLVVSVGAFLAVIVLGGVLAGATGAVWTATVSPFLARAVPAVVPIPVIAGALLWSLDGGLLGMLSVGIPYVLTFYLLLATLEDSGYLTSAAVLMDRLFGILGLPGRAAIPILAAAGCNVPAIYGTRVLRTRRERVLGAFLVSLVPCSARSAVVIAAVAPYAGPAAALAAFGVVAGATVAAGLAANALIPGRQSPLVLELAPLRVPLPRHVAVKAWWRFRGFVVTATPIMLVGSLVLGFVYEAGWWQAIAGAIGPTVEWALGLPAIAGVAIVFAFLRKELALQLLIAFAAIQLGHATGLGELMTPPQLFVYAVVSSLSIPCIATMAALRGELGWRPAAGIALATVSLAIGTGALLARLLGTAAT
jgi:ferrous iron transport protein B